jgi:short-subunit dehydrogenase
MKKTITSLTVVIFIGMAIYYFYPIDSVSPVSSHKKAIIIGATSGVGKALATVLSHQGYELGLVGRRVLLLQELKSGLPNASVIKQLDVSKPDDAMRRLKELIAEMHGVDLIIINAGVGYSDVAFDWTTQKQMIDVNVVGFAAMAHVALEHFMQQQRGHLVGISSIAAHRATPYGFTYSATKAFVSRLLEGIRNTVHTKNLPIYVTTIEPGFIDTDMIKDVPNKMWVASPAVAAQQIYDAIQAKKEHAYVTKRWRFVAWFLKFAPNWLCRMGDHEPFLNDGKALARAL